MDKEAVLAKSRKDNSYLDEMQQSDLRNGFGFGGAIVAVLCVLFSLIRALTGKSFFEFGVILFGYMAAASLYSFFKIKRKHFLIRGIAECVACAAGFIGYLFL